MQFIYKGVSYTSTEYGTWFVWVPKSLPVEVHEKWKALSLIGWHDRETETHKRYEVKGDKYGDKQTA